jgi:hypothetical protein
MTMYAKSCFGLYFGMRVGEAEEEGNMLQMCKVERKANGNGMLEECVRGCFF